MVAKTPDVSFEPSSFITSDLAMKGESKSNSGESHTRVLPPFSVTSVKTSLCVTLNVKHVLPESVSTTLNITSKTSEIVLSLTNGACEYKLCLSLLSDALLVKSLPVADIWDNNFTLQFELDFRTSNTSAVDCELFFGCDWIRMENANVGDLLEDIIEGLLKRKSKPSPAMARKSRDQEDQSSVDMVDVDDLLDCRPTVRSSDKAVPRAFRSVSESSDDGSLSTTPNRGILKKRSGNRSLSESSMEDFSFKIYSLDASCMAIPESFKDDEEFYGSMDRSKKTVRFSDVVKEQLFRSGSSILGQRKKNQRKTNCKKRKLSLSSSMESIDGDHFERPEQDTDEQTDEQKDDAQGDEGDVDSRSEEQRDNADSAGDNNHCDSGIEFDGQEPGGDGKKQSKKSKKKKGKAKKQKGDITDLMFAMEI